jgi:hypothetical protein
MKVAITVCAITVNNKSVRNTNDLLGHKGPF